MQWGAPAVTQAPLQCNTKGGWGQGCLGGQVCIKPVSSAFPVEYAEEKMVLSL